MPHAGKCLNEIVEQLTFISGQLFFQEAIDRTAYDRSENARAK